MPQTIFATPTLDSRVSLEFHQSMLVTTWLLAERNIKHGFLHRGGDQFIAKARSKLAWEFLQNYPDATELFFLDDDIGWPAEKVLAFIESDAPVICGVYPKKQDPVDWPVQLTADPKTRRLIEKDGLLLAMGAPTGFMRIKRHVLEAIAPRAPMFKDAETTGTGEWPMIFCTGIGPDGFFWGEDYSFCRLCAQLGFEIWVDPDIAFTHRGHKKWEGNLKAALPTFRRKARQANFSVVETMESSAA